VRQVTATGAASAVALPPRSLPARKVAPFAMGSTPQHERVCTECASRCAGPKLYQLRRRHILRAGLAASGREAVA